MMDADKARQQARVRVLKKYREIEKKEGWVVDFEDFKQAKYSVCYDYETKTIGHTFIFSLMVQPTENHTSIAATSYAINNMQEDLLLMLGVEQCQS